MNGRARRSDGLTPIGKSVPEPFYPPQFRTNRPGIDTASARYEADELAPQPWYGYVEVHSEYLFSSSTG